MVDKEWALTPLAEQETTLNVNYDEKVVRLYTSRKAVAKRLYAQLGEPEIINEQNDVISSVTYVRSLQDKNIKPIFTMGVLIGQFRKPVKK